MREMPYAAAGGNSNAQPRFPLRASVAAAASGGTRACAWRAVARGLKGTRLSPPTRI